MAHGQWTEVEARAVLKAWSKSSLPLGQFAKERGLEGAQLDHVPGGDGEHRRRVSPRARPRGGLRGRLPLTTNESVSRGTVFGDDVTAATLLDRPLHHSHTMMLQGDSRRKRKAGRSELQPRAPVG